MSTRFTTRAGGVSQGGFASLNLALHVGDLAEDVRRNREIAAIDVGAYLAGVQYMNQVHGNRVVIVEERSDEEPTADALVTGIPGINLAVMVADVHEVTTKDSSMSLLTLSTAATVTAQALPPAV
jgi:copper oxidase (laccase) domain-containing protein